MSDFTLTSSDHILAQGVKFWTSVVEDHQIEELDQCYQIITALGEFLTTLNSPVYEENVDTMENATFHTSETRFQNSSYKAAHLRKVHKFSKN